MESLFKNKLFRQFVKNIPAPIAIFDKDMRYIGISDRWMKDYNLQESDVLGKSHYEVFPEIKENMPQWAEYYRRGFAGESSHKEGDPFLRKDGSLDYIDWKIQPWRTESGEIGGIIMYTEIVTQKKVAEDEIGRLSSIISNMQEAIALIDLGKENILRYVNPAWENLFGYSFDEVVNKREGLIIEAAQRVPELKEKLENNIKAGKLFSLEMQWKRKDGSLIWIEVSSSPLRNDEGNITMWINTIRDVTARKHAEKKVDELNELRNIFIKIVSHQLRTPLNSMRWNLEALLAGELGEMKTEQREFIRVTYDADVEIIRRIHDLLTAMDIEEGRVALSKQEISIDSLWGSVMTNWKKKCVIKDISCEYKPSEEVLPTVRVDAEKIRDVFEKLSDNAVTYTANGGKNTASLKKVDSMIRFEISDNGIGIPKVEQPRIFNRFYRATNAPTMKPDASGLGLAIAKYFIEQHGGKIGFNSEEGKGSIFWFELPI